MSTLTWISPDEPPSKIRQVFEVHYVPISSITELENIALAYIDNTNAPTITHLKDQNPRAYVCVSSHDNEAASRIAYLEAGADDCLPQDYDIEELIARLKALEQRLHVLIEHARIGDIVVDPQHMKVTVGSKNIVVTPTECALLAFLVAKSPHSVSRSRILFELWGSHSAESSRSLNTHIKNLRKKVFSQSHNVILETKRGYGYTIIIKG